MDFDRRFFVGFLGLSLAAGSSVCLPQRLLAQGLLQRVEQRREAREQQNAQQQNPSQQQNPAQQPMQQAPAGAPDVSMVMLQTQPGAGGQQMVVTPKGLVVPLPGAGVEGPMARIYMGGQGGFWYIDKNNQQVDLTSAVQVLQGQARQTQAAPMATVPQYAPQPTSYGQPMINAQPMATAAAAGLGVAAGAAMASTNTGWGNVPYGAPIHYGAGAVPYYNNGGKPIYINNSTTANYNEANAYHATAMQQQQEWYRQQQVAQGANWKTWQQPTANPFVAPAYGATAAAYGAAEGQQSARYGAAAGATAAHYGAEQGQQAARYGAAEGATAAHYGSEQGQQAARYGAAEGASAAHHGTEEGQQAARYGAAEGASAAHHGTEQGEQARRFGAAEGARGEDGAKRTGRFSGRGGAGDAEGRRRMGR